MPMNRWGCPNNKVVRTSTEDLLWEAEKAEGP